MGTTVAGLEGVIAGESEICYIDGYAGILSYRGYKIHTLADMRVLRMGDLPPVERLAAQARRARPIKKDLRARALPRSGGFCARRTAVEHHGHAAHRGLPC